MLDGPPQGERAPTRVGAVMASLKARIDARALAPGARMPSVRALTATLGVSKSTVVEAYDRLVAEGAVVARRGSGFFVAGRTRPLVLARAVERREPVADWLWSIRASLEADPHLIQPGSGWLPESWMPELGMQRALRDLARDGDFRRTQYDSPIGFAPLRQQLAVRMAERGVAASPDQIVLTDSGTQAIDLAMRFLVQPGDTVAVDDPSYFRMLPLLARIGSTSSPRR